jgi:tRNA threonylcarbamoyladenosine biosynthesis protein TsaE
VEEIFVKDEAAMRALGRQLSGRWRAGDLVLLFGDLGAGKTTFVRGVLEGLSWAGAVRSPTFNLMSVYEVDPPVLHADLYRVASAEGLGLEEYFEDHLCLIEWPDRLGLVDRFWRVEIGFEGDGRRVVVESSGS